MFPVGAAVRLLLVAQLAMQLTQPPCCQTGLCQVPLGSWLESPFNI